MEFVGKVVSSVYKASSVVGDKSTFVGEFGALVQRIMDDPSKLPSPLETYVGIVTGEEEGGI